MTERAKKLLLLYCKQGGKIRRVSGLPPLTFKAKKAGTLNNYHIYGNTENGESVGYRTENLFDLSSFFNSIMSCMNGTWSHSLTNFTINATSRNSYLDSYSANEEYKLPVLPNTPYTLSFLLSNSVDSNPCNIIIDENNSLMYGYVHHETDVTTQNAKFTFTTGNNAEFVTFTFSVSNANTSQTFSAIMFNSGSTALPYEPYGYKIPVTLTADSAETTDIYLDEPLKKGMIYGFHIDPSVSYGSNAVTYLADAVGKTPAAMGENTFSFGDWENAFFIPKPCMLKSDGTVDYYLDPNDYTKKVNGTQSDVANASYDGNAMMEWGKIWYKFVPTETDGEVSFYVADFKADNDFECWCNIDSQNNEIDHFYTAIYNGTGTEKLRSISGVALKPENGNGGTTVTQEIERATANNTTNNVEWYTEVYSDRMLINMLLVLMGKSLNSQDVYGLGLVYGGHAEREAYVTGALNDKGLFWGEINAVGALGVKVFGMENYWGCKMHRIAGFISIDNHAYAKLTYSTADGSSTTGYNQTGTGYLDFGSVPNTNGWIKTMKYNRKGLMPSTIGTYSERYYSDYYYQETGTAYLLLGGSSDAYISDRIRAGAHYFNLSVPAAKELLNVTTALSCKPISKGGKSPHTAADYIDYATQKRHNRDGTESSITLPAISTLAGTNTLTVGTEVQLSSVKIKGRIKAAGGD